METVLQDLASWAIMALVFLGVFWFIAAEHPLRDIYRLGSRLKNSVLSKTER